MNVEVGNMLAMKQGRHRRWRALGLVALTIGLTLGLFGSDECLGGEPNKPATVLATQDFTLGGRRFEASLPVTAKVRYLGKMASIILDAHARLPSVINVYPGSANVPKLAGTSKTTRFTSGAAFTYTLRTGDAGKGETQEFLVGRLSIGGAILGVTCSSQGEFAHQGDWCIPYIGSIRIK